jgi:excisionase family DNA binding protein
MVPANSAGTAASIPRRPRYVSTSVIANRLGVSSRTIRLWAECGQLPAIKVGRQWRIEEGDFEQWISGHQHLSLPQ